MRSLKLEQVAVVKFLTLEGSTKEEIFRRVKEVFSSFTLPKNKIFKLYYRFLKEGLLGDKGDIPYVEKSSVESSNQFYSFRKASQKYFENNPIPENSGEMQLYNEVELKNEYVTDSDFLESNHGIEIVAKEASVVHKKDYVKKDEVLTSKFSSQVVPHPSIFNSQEEALSSLEAKQTCCAVCEGKNFDFPFLLRRHFKCLHLNHNIQVGPFVCLLCRCGRSDSSFLRSHYHCPLCPHVTQKTRIAQHYKQHHIYSSNLEDLLRGGVKEKSCICISQGQGLFIVPKTNREPTHVIRTLIKGKLIAKCSEELCNAAMAKAKENGVLNLHCKHILRANDKTVEYISNEDIFNEILTSETLDISEEDRNACFYLIKQALKQSVPPVIEWVPPTLTDFSYFSVFCDASYAFFGRIIVKYDFKNDTFICKCPLMKESSLCPYERLSEIYLRYSR